MQRFSLYPFIDSEFSPVGYFLLTSCDIFPLLLKEDSYESTCFINPHFAHKNLFAIAIGVLAVVVLPFLSYYTVNEGERGILLRYGKNRKVAEPGWVLRSLYGKRRENFHA